MMLVSKTYWAGLPFWFRKPPEHASVESLVLRAHDLRQLRAHYWIRRDVERPKIGVVVIHPRVDFSHHYSIPKLVAAGFAVLAGTTRHANNDTMAEHEEMVLDVAACVRHLLEKRGVEKVVFFGNSGGGSLSAFYQAQAKRAPAARLERSPGGSPTHFGGATMPPAHGLALVAAHRGQGQVLLDCIDPAVVDEVDPLAVDPALDLYDPRNGFAEPPAWSSYDASFLQRYRAAQVARVQRLDATARSLIARQTEASATSLDGLSPDEQRATMRRRAHETIMVVHRTMANPRYVDRTIDPSGREYGSLLSERPDLMNYAALGFARTCTPRAWLSTWSGLSSNADLVANVAQIDEPTLIVHAGRDREIFPADFAAVVAASAATDKRAVTIEHARHYFEPDLGDKATPHVDEVMELVVGWIQERFA